MELSRHHRTASLNFGALLSKGSSMPLTRAAANVMVGDTSSTVAVDKLSERIADAPSVSELGLHLESLTEWANRMAGNPSPPKAGVKLDAGKAPVAQAFVAYFSRAMEAIARVSQYGAEKYKVAYSEQNWRKVENGQNRYADALQRHFAAHLAGETIDPESKQPHLAHVGWNAMALLELQDAMPEKLVDGQ